MKKFRGEEILVEASLGGRRLTLDPIRVVTVPLEVREVESTIPCGFQSVWGEAGEGDRRIELTAGAGMGSRWGTIVFRGKTYCFDANQLINAFVDELDKKVPDGKDG